MRILHLCKKFPYPVKDGETLAIQNLGKALHENNVELTLLAMNTFRHYYHGHEIPNDLDHYDDVITSDVDNRITLTGAVRNLFSTQSYHIQRFITEDFRQKLAGILSSASYDAVLMETLYLAPYIDTIRQYSNALILMRSHNVEHEIWERAAKNETNFLKRKYLEYLAAKLRHFEIRQLDRYDVLVSISERDLQTFRQLGYDGEGFTMPMAIDLKDYPIEEIKTADKVHFSFIGSLDWLPNQQGVKWFLDQIWQSYLRQSTSEQFHIAGRNTPEWLSRLQIKNVFVHGEVPSATEFLRNYPVTVVPLLSGSGMRVKIIEAMALGRVVITTSIGLEGIPAEDHSEVLIADTVESFVGKMKFCREHPEEVRRISSRARTFILRHYDRKTVARQLLETLEKGLV